MPGTQVEAEQTGRRLSLREMKGERLKGGSRQQGWAQGGAVPGARCHCQHQVSLSQEAGPGPMGRGGASARSGQLVAAPERR